MQRGSTLFLRAGVTMIGLGVLALCIFLLPLMWVGAYGEHAHGGYTVRVVVAAMYLSALLFYIGVYNGWRVLDLVDTGKAFSMQSVRRLRVIAYCAAIISAIYAVSLPFFYAWAQLTDAPGLMVIGLFLVGMPLIISVAMGLLQRLLAEVVTIKSENDLTV